MPWFLEAWKQKTYPGSIWLLQVLKQYGNTLFLIFYIQF